MLEKYCEKQGWEVVAVYQDDGFTGLNMERPDLQRMLRAIERRQINLVITKDLSRLGRNCGMIFPPEDRYTLHHTEDPNCPSHVEPGQKARPVSLAADYARHRAESAPRPQPSQRPTKPTYQNSNSGRRKGSQIAGLIIALVWVVICLMISFANISFANMR